MIEEISNTLIEQQIGRNVKRCINYPHPIFAETLTLIHWAGDYRYMGSRAKSLAKLDYSIEVNTAINESAHEGKLYVIVWGRDCDHTESQYLRTIPANRHALNKLEDWIADGAEGPFTLSIISHKESLDFEASQFDRAAYNAGY
jgi:hypothetical protein